MDGTALNDYQDSLVQTVHACGRTLLDTVNQVLDYGKVVSIGKNLRQIQRNRDTPSKSTVHDNGGLQLDTSVHTDVAVLVEEVVEGVCLGYRYQDNSAQSLSVDQTLPPQTPADRQSMRSVSHDRSCEDNVDVIVDIAQNDWVYKTQPGALRRIIMNVFGNAMKYTQKGCVRIKLAMNEPSTSLDDQAQTSPHGSEGSDWMTLTVSDTGKGISEDFLRGRIYTPFAQENTLMAGTGLGLSIVRSIVKALEGNVTIQSRPNDGTTVKVSLPLTRSVGEDSPPSSPKESLVQTQIPLVTSLSREGYSGRKAAIWGVSRADAMTHPLWALTARYLTDWFCFELVSWPASDSPIDILMINESDLSAASKERDNPSTTPWPPLLVFSRGPVDAEQTALLASTASLKIVRSPYGPHKLANQILKCLKEQQRKRNPPPLSLSTDELPIRPKAANPLEDVKPLARSMLELFSEKNSKTNHRHSQSRPVTDVRTHSDSTESASTSDARTSVTTTSSPFSLSSQPSYFYFSNIQSPDSQPPPQPSPPRPAKVLVVDDNSINRNLMLTYMKKRKRFAALDSASKRWNEYETVMISSSWVRLILNLMFLCPLDYIISTYPHNIYSMETNLPSSFFPIDISMPVMDGFEATRVIRSLERERDSGSPAFVIALTGLSSSEHESEALASGFDLFLTKPVSLKEVSRLLDEWEAKGCST